MNSWTESTRQRLHLFHIQLSVSSLGVQTSSSSFLPPFFSLSSSFLFFFFLSSYFFLQLSTGRFSSFFSDFIFYVFQTLTFPTVNCRPALSSTPPHPPTFISYDCFCLLFSFCLTEATWRTSLAHSSPSARKPHPSFCRGGRGYDSHRHVHLY